MERSVFVAAPFLAFVSIGAGLSAQDSRIVNRKISGPLLQGVLGTVVRAEFSPSGDRVLFQTLDNETLRSRLSVVPSDGSASPTMLSAGEDPSVESARWTSDGTRAVYRARLGDGRYELLGVLADGSAAPELLTPLPAFGSVDTTFPFQLTTDGSRVVFKGDLSTDGRFELYSAPTDGSAAPLRLNPALASGRTILSYDAGSAGSRVAYLCDQLVANTFELFSVPADGSTAAIKISHTLAAGEDVFAFALDPSGARAAYLAGTGSSRRLYSVPLDGSAAAVQLSPSLASDRTVESFRISPDGASVVYRADQTANEQYELFVVPIDGGASPLLLTPVSAGGQVLANSYRISPDSARAVCVANTSGTTKLFGAAMDGSALVELHSSNNIDVPGIEVSADSARVVFDLIVGFRKAELYSVPIGGGSAAVRLNPTFVAGGELQEVALSPDSLQAVYRADADQVGVVELYRVALDPPGSPSATKLNDPLVAGGDVSSLEIDAGGSHVLFLADGNVDARVELSRSALAGAPAAQVLSDPLPTGVVGDVFNFVARNGRVVYAADQDVDGRVELYGVPIDHSVPAVRLNAPLVAGGNVASGYPAAAAYVLTPDGSRVVYVADGEVDERTELFSAPADGSAPAVKLNTTLTAGTNIFPAQFRVSPDGSRVVYLADQAAHPGARLYSVAITGGPPTALGPTPLSSFMEISADSTHVLFSNTRFYAVPIDGSTAAVDLSGPVTLIDVFHTSPDGTRAVYIATVSGADHLFSTPLTGGRVELNNPLVAGGNVTDFAFSADGTRVVFRADADVDERFALYSVPIDRSMSPVVIAGGFVAGGDAITFRVTPDSTRVVYVADQDVDNLFNPYSVAIDGSAPSVRLSASAVPKLGPYEITPDRAHLVILFSSGSLKALPITGGSAVTLVSAGSVPFQVSADGRVIYQRTDGAGLGLFSRAVHGGPPMRLTPVPVGSIASFQLDGQGVVYRSNQEAPFTEELFSSLPRHVAAATTQ